MLSKIILILSLFVRILSGCASTIENGVPTIALNICVSARVSGMIKYIQLTCDSTETAVLLSMHHVSDCSDNEIISIPYPMQADWALNCEEKYDCSYAVYRHYNSTKCAHSIDTMYIDMPMITNECGYDPSIYGSRMYTCDDTAIYSNVQMNDMDALCEDTLSIVYLEEGCNNETGVYNEIVKCTAAVPSITTSHSISLSAGAIVGIVVAILVIIAVILVIIFVIICKKKKKILGYGVVGTTASKNVASQKQSDEGEKNIQQIPVYIKTDIPPPPPPPISQTQMVNFENEYLIQKSKYVISEWLKRYAEIPQTDANKYADIFVTNGFDTTAALKEITMSDLVEIGISKIGHRKVIMRAVQTEHCLLQPASV